MKYSISPINHYNKFVEFTSKGKTYIINTNPVTEFKDSAMLSPQAHIQVSKEYKDFYDERGYLIFELIENKTNLLSIKQMKTLNSLAKWYKVNPVVQLIKDGYLNHKTPTKDFIIQDFLKEVDNKIRSLGFALYDSISNYKITSGLILVFICAVAIIITKNNRVYNNPAVQVKTEIINEVTTGLQEPISYEDSMSNIRIHSLQCTEQDFLQRQAFNTGFTDLKKTSLKRKIITFKQGYSESESYDAYIITKAVVKTFRDFPCINEITFVLPINGVNKKYYTTRSQAERDLNLDFNYLRENIVNFRREYYNNDSKFNPDFYIAYANSIKQ